jgi:hypothetical protein
MFEHLSPCGDRRQLKDIQFEQSDLWLPVLQTQLVRLAQRIRGSQEHTQASAAPYAEAPAFPSALVLEELEELGATLDVCGGDADEGDAGAAADESKRGGPAGERGWAVRLFGEVGFTHGTLVESLVGILDHWQGKAPEKVLHLLSSTAYTLLQWTRQAAE